MVQLVDSWGHVLDHSGVLSLRAIDPTNLPTGTSDRQPLGIAPFLNYRLGNGWYIGNGDLRNAEACLEETLRLDAEHPQAPAALQSVREAISGTPN